MRNDLEAPIAEILPRIVELRHDLHAHPELAFDETYTSELIQRELGAAGIEFRAGLAETGVVGWILPQDPAARARKAVGLRADMDALPVPERTGKPYASRNPGRAHACGHDGNTAMLLGAGMVLAGLADELPRPVKLVFQPAEERGGGARKLIEQGAMGAEVGGCEIGAMFALHADALLPVGRLGLRSGPSKARVDSFDLVVEGRGGHGGRPHETRDPIVAAAQVLVALQTIVSRNVLPLDAAVVTVGKFHAGAVRNVIPDRAELSGTIRTFRDETAELVRRRIADLATGLARGMGCEAHVTFSDGYPVTDNDPAAAERFRAAAAFLGPDGVFEDAPSMGAEDFAFYCQLIPSCIAGLGVRPADAAEGPGLHNPKFDFNDEALPIGIRLLCELALAGSRLEEGSRE